MIIPQTIKELKEIVGRDHQLLHLFINIQQDLSKSKPSNNDFYPQKTIPQDKDTKKGIIESS